MNSHRPRPVEPHQGVPYERRIFCNRNLDLQGVEVIGFDMDYTLAVYKETLKALTTRLTVSRLVHTYGYPEEVLEIEYDPYFPVRGLVLDTKLGNLIKRDAHQHVSVALHAFERLSSEEKRAAYPKGSVRLGPKRFVSIDTLFELPEAYIFSRLVDMAHRSGQEMTAAKYGALYKQIRKAVDDVHRDGTLKGLVMQHPERYVYRDLDLALALKQFRAAGKKLFVLTNSEWSYTDGMMSFLLDDALPEVRDWREYFDWVVVASRKPGFFSGKEPFRTIGEDGEPADPTDDLSQPVAGGNLREFEKILPATGSAVLYVGDHIYGDVLRSKKIASWRTAMIVPEMERELRHLRFAKELIEQRNGHEQHRRELYHHRLSLRMQLREPAPRTPEGETRRSELEHELAQIEGRLAACDLTIARTTRRIDRYFNPHWGMLLKCGPEHSAFGAQVETYACVYTSRASNFANYTATEYFRTPRDLMPHEHVIPISGA